MRKGKKEMNYSNDVKIMILKNRIGLLEARGGSAAIVAKLKRKLRSYTNNRF